MATDGDSLQTRLVVRGKDQRTFPHDTLSCLAELDTAIGRWIEGKSNYRRPGKWEVKPHGFEYRLLLWKGDAHELLKITNALNTMTECARSVPAMFKALHQVAGPQWVSKDLLATAEVG